MRKKSRLQNSRDTIPSRAATNQACYQAGIMPPEYLCGQPPLGLDGIVAYVYNNGKNSGKWCKMGSTHMTID